MRRPRSLALLLLAAVVAGCATGAGPERPPAELPRGLTVRGMGAPGPGATGEEATRSAFLAVGPQASAPATATADRAPRECPGAASGLILDARGTKLRPAMAPRIVTAGGRAVYVPGLVAREVLLGRGVAEYSVEPDRSRERVGDNPLLIKAVAVAGRGETDAVVSDADAVRAGEANACPRFLERARVLFVIDR